jgi:hypothetical protein
MGADAPRLLRQQDPAEEIRLEVETVETAHVSRRIDTIKVEGLVANFGKGRGKPSGRLIFRLH